MTLLAKLIGWLAPYLLWVVGGAGIAAAGYGGVMHLERDAARKATVEAKAETKKVNDDWTLDKARRTQVALDAEIQQRNKEQGWQAQIKGAQDELDHLKADNAKKLAAFAARASHDLADNTRLRADLAAFAAGGGSGSQDTAASASQRAAALALLLADALRLEDATLLAGAKSTSAAEGNGDAVRALLKAWPHDDESMSPGNVKLGS
jgi:hypothetical protein